ncbi:MAG: hypothetical protein ACR2IE_11965 [Candidatus Sumerlaeaceae bacterium]
MYMLKSMHTQFSRLRHYKLDVDSVTSITYRGRQDNSSATVEIIRVDADKLRIHIARVDTRGTETKYMDLLVCFDGVSVRGYDAITKHSVEGTVKRNDALTATLSLLAQSMPGQLTGYLFTEKLTPYDHMQMERTGHVRTLTTSGGRFHILTHNNRELVLRARALPLPQSETIAVPAKVDVRVNYRWDLNSKSPLSAFQFSPPPQSKRVEDFAAFLQSAHY